MHNLNDAITRYTATIDYITNLARLGLRDNTIRITVPYTEWMYWLDETARGKYGVQITPNERELRFYCVAGIMVVVTVQQ